MAKVEADFVKKTNPREIKERDGQTNKIQQKYEQSEKRKSERRSKERKVKEK